MPDTDDRIGRAIETLTFNKTFCKLTAMEITLGQRLRQLREKRDLSLRELGEKLGEKVGKKSAAFLSDVEFGRRFPSEEVLKALAKALGTTFDALKKYDNRVPMADVREKVLRDPALAVALRTVLDKGIKGDELLKLIKDRKKP